MTFLTFLNAVAWLVFLAGCALIVWRISGILTPKMDTDIWKEWQEHDRRAL